MNKELKIISIYKHEGVDWLTCYIAGCDLDEDEEGYGILEDIALRPDFDDDLTDEDTLATPSGAYFFVGTYKDEILYFSSEYNLEEYIEVIDDPGETPIPGLWSYHGDGLDIEDQPAHVIIKEVLKKRGYI